MKKLTKTEAELKNSAHSSTRSSGHQKIFFIRKKVLNPTKTSEKDHLFNNTVSLKKSHSFYEPRLTRH